MGVVFEPHLHRKCIAWREVRRQVRLGYWMLACVAVLWAPHRACGACLVRLKTLGGRPFYVP